MTPWCDVFGIFFNFFWNFLEFSKNSKKFQKFQKKLKKIPKTDGGEGAHSLVHGQSGPGTTCAVRLRFTRPQTTRAQSPAFSSAGSLSPWPLVWGCGWGGVRAWGRGGRGGEFGMTPGCVAVGSGRRPLASRHFALPFP